LAARKVIGAVAEGDMLRTQMAILRRLAKYEPADTVALGRQIARHVLGDTVSIRHGQSAESCWADELLSLHNNPGSGGSLLWTTGDSF
jgi:hypothetical protein